LLFAALGGTQIVADLFGRDRSTAAKWRSGALPIPAAVARQLRSLTRWAAQHLLDEAERLAEEIPERRAAEGEALRRRAFLKLRHVRR
jgi:hypothetical protein